MMVISRIVVPTDFSKAANKALRLAQELAGPSGAEIFLVHVVQPIIIGASLEISGGSAAVAKIQAEQERFAKRRLDKMGAALRKKKRAAIATLVRTGAVHQSILAVADKVAADLIVMGTQGRSGLSHLLLGSVAERVVRLAHCPVLTVGSRARAGARRRRKKR